MSKTIAALATAPGISGLAVIRLSGSKSFDIIDKCFRGKLFISDAPSHTIHYGKIYNADVLIDSVTVSVFRSPNSYTGENVVEIGCHGGNIISNLILDLLYKLGASLPEPGEFTKRAFLNNKLDLTQVEAVADLIHSISKPSAEFSARQLNGQLSNKLSELRQQLLDIAGFLELEIDFAEEDIKFLDRAEIENKINETINFCENLIALHKSSDIIKSGFFVSFVGFPNSGKSSLFNTLLNKKRAIVSDIAGTTRDYLEEYIYINDIPIKLIDTAGIRDSDNVIEIEGIKLVEDVINNSNLIFVINDVSLGISHSKDLFTELSKRHENVYLLQNKIDLIKSQIEDHLSISAISSQGIQQLKQFIFDKANLSFSRTTDVLINDRQVHLLKEIITSLNNSIQALHNDFENELIAIDLKDAINSIGKINGETWNEEVINNIFSNFCIGK